MGTVNQVSTLSTVPPYQRNPIRDRTYLSIIMIVLPDVIRKSYILVRKDHKMAALDFFPTPSDEESRHIGETVILQNITLRKSLHSQISENDALRQQLAIQRAILTELAFSARNHVIEHPMHDLIFAHALADALAYLKEE